MQERAEKLAEIGVNALSRAHVISTRQPQPTARRRQPRVNALSRAHVISTEEKARLERASRMCQCPISGSRHFYNEKDRKPYPAQRVSMPYLGLTSFLQIITGASRGYLWCVNALSRAHVISTNSKDSLVIYTRIGVNALSRAHVISTRFRRNTHKRLWLVSMPYLGLTSFLQKEKKRW